MADPSGPARLHTPAGRRRYRRSFDEDPAAYDASRPVPPAQVFDDLVALAGLSPGDRILEIGPGTGQATRPLLERGASLPSSPAMPSTGSSRRSGLPRRRACSNRAGISP